MHKHVLFALATVASSAFTVSAQAQEVDEDRLAELEDRLDAVEKKTILDRIQLGGDYRTTLNSVFYEGPTPDPWDKDPNNPAVGRRIESDFNEIWSHRLRLTMHAEPSESVRVDARLVMYKHFGDGDAPPFIQDSMTTRIPRDSGARFERAWIDWFMTEWLAISAGRIAYSEGNPAELKENSRVRGATWGLHMVDGEYDTVNLTLNLSAILDQTYMRLFYTSWFNDSDADAFGGVPFIDSGTENLRILGGNVELKIPGLGDNFVQLGYYYVPRFRPFFVPIPDPGYDPGADYTGAPVPLNGALLFPTRMPNSMGSYQNISALIEFYDLFDAGLDLFASGAIGFLSPNNRGISYNIPSNLNDPSSPRMAFPFLFLASTGDDGMTTFIYAGGRFSIPVREENPPKVGFEYNYGSRYHISFAVQTDNLMNKLVTRGSAYEGYVILPFDDHLFVRLAYLYIDNDYMTGFFGPNPAAFGSTAPEAPAQTHSLNLTLHATL